MSASDTLDASPSEEAPQEYSNTRLTIGFFALIVGMFMAILDIQIVASSIRQIQAGVSASAEEIAWVQTGYLIAEVVGIPISGFLVQVLGLRRLFTISAGAFILSSLLCAMAWDLESLVFFRIIQGFVGAAMMPLAMTAGFTLFPNGRNILQQVAMGMVATLAPSIGPTLGGWITENSSWHWLFLLNIGPGIAAIIVVQFCIPDQNADYPRLRRLDILSLVAMALFLGSLEWVVEEAPAAGWFQDGHIVRWALFCGVAGVIFIWRSLSTHTPAVDLRIFSNLNFSSGAVTGFVVGFGLYGSVYGLPLFLSQVRGYSAMQIGEIMSVAGIAMFVAGPITGRLIQVFDPRKIMFVGLVLGGIGVWMNGQMTAQTGFNELVLPQALRGAGIMLIMISATNIAITTLPPEKVANATSLFTVCRNLGGALGIAIMNTQMLHFMNLHRQELAAGLDPGRPDVQASLADMSRQLAAAGVTDPEAAALAQLAGRLNQEAAVMTYNNLFQFMAMCFFAAIVMLPFMKRPPPPKVAPMRSSQPAAQPAH